MFVLFAIAVAAAAALAYKAPEYLRQPVYTDTRLLGAEAVYLEDSAPRLAIQLPSSLAKDVYKVTVSVYGWFPDGRIKPLGNYTTRNGAVTLDETRIRSYIAAWRSHIASKGSTPDYQEPPLIILATIIVKNKGIYTVAKTVPIRTDLVAKGAMPTIRILDKPVLTARWDELPREFRDAVLGKKPPTTTKSIGAAGTSTGTPTPPPVIPISPIAYWIFEEQDPHLHVHLPAAVAHVHGPDTDTVNDVNLIMMFVTGSQTTTEIYFTTPMASYDAGLASITAYIVSGYSWKIQSSETNTWAKVHVLYINKPGSSTVYRIEGTTGGELTSTVAIDMSSGAYMAVGIVGDANYAKYRLYICDYCIGIACYCKPEDKYLYATYVRPSTPIKDKIEVWYEADTLGEGFAKKAIDAAWINNKPEYFGGFDSGFIMDSSEYAQKISTLPIFSLTLSVPVPARIGGFPAALAEASVGMASASWSFSLASMSIAPKADYADNGYCEIWPTLFESRARFMYYGVESGQYVGDYPFAVLYGDVYAWTWPCG
ncbi:hypothetical protein [Pyrodictium abyssi]|uniref:Uncharacterized protein n=1 Tax=Pyrodictium abyssi TaxID=54256 RepID=A0ABN6ZT19_9CREN|nr:hypothetical protein PABY_14020 [Pyrodictium abyssi]